jgi:cytochrome c2
MVLRFGFHHIKKQSVCQSSGQSGMGYGVAVVNRRGVLPVLLSLALFLACNRHQKQSSALAIAGNENRGKAAIERYGCNACHDIPGIPGPKGKVGPPLAHMASRSFIAGKFPNNPQTMINWLQDPPKYDPQSAMPNLGVTPADSRDISAYLYTLK